MQPLPCMCTAPPSYFKLWQSRDAHIKFGIFTDKNHFVPLEKKKKLDTAALVLIEWISGGTDMIQEFNESATMHFP